MDSSSKQTAMTESAAKTLNVTGLLCPIPVLRTRRALDSMQVGEKLTITASDPASVHDMPAFCKMAGHKLLMAHETAGVITFEVEKGTEKTAN